MDAFFDAVPEIMAKGARIVVLGQGDPHLEARARALEKRFRSKKFRALVMFDPKVAQKIYLGADIFVNPARYEPCGLTHKTAMLCGTVPVGTDHGAMHTDIRDYSDRKHTLNEATGFLIGKSGAARAIVFKVVQAIEMVDWGGGHLRSVQRNCLASDFSWDASVKEYMRVLFPS